MDLWDESLNISKLTSMLDGNSFILFIKKGDDVFGCSENGRLTFARMKDPAEEENLDDASFLAMNLKKMLAGDEDKEKLFTKKDLEDIEILDRDKLNDFFK